LLKTNVDQEVNKMSRVCDWLFNL